MKKILTTFILAIISCSISAQTKYIQYKDIKRKYIVYAPKNYNSEKSYPVIFNFHGGGMTAAEQMLYTQMNHTADKHNFIVVYPQGIKEDWNVGFGMSYKNGTDDIGFTDALLNQIQKDYSVDSKKVFATGLSRGGFFVHRIAAELPHRFAGVASIGAPLPDSVAIHNPIKKDISVLMVHGKADEIVVYEGKKGGYYSAQNTFDYWKDSDAVVKILKKIDKVKSDNTSIEVLEANSKTKSVMLISIENGGHTWPGADDFNIALPIGITSHEININEYMWAFFNMKK